jgi:hypothetical protein
LFGESTCGRAEGCVWGAVQSDDDYVSYEDAEKVCYTDYQAGDSYGGDAGDFFPLFY